MRILIYALGLTLCVYSLGCSDSSRGGFSTVAPVQSGSSAGGGSNQGTAPVGSGAVSGLYSLTAVHGAVVIEETAAGEQFSFVSDAGVAYVVSDTAAFASYEAHPGATLTLNGIASVTSSGTQRLEQIEQAELDDVVAIASRQLTQGVAPLPVLRSSAGELFAVEGPLRPAIEAATLQVPLFVTGVRGALNAQGETALRVTSWRYSRQVRYERYAPGASEPTQVVSMDDLLGTGGRYHLLLDQAGTSGDLLYVVQAGDTLGAIAATYNTTVAAIAARNAIANVNLINVGMQLFIPGAGQATPAVRRGGDGTLDALQRQGIDALVAGIDFTTTPRQFVGAGAAGEREVLRYGDSTLSVEIEIEEGASLTPELDALRTFLRDFDQAVAVSRFERVERGLNSAIAAPAIHVIRDAAALSAVWQQLDPTGATTPPTVDFTQEAVVAVFLGSQAPVGGTVDGVRVDTLRRVGSHLVLETGRESIDGVTDPAATPYELVRVTLAGANGRFFTDRQP